MWSSLRLNGIGVGQAGASLQMGEGVRLLPKAIPLVILSGERS